MLPCAIYTPINREGTRPLLNGLETKILTNIFKNNGVDMKFIPSCRVKTPVVFHDCLRNSDNKGMISCPRGSTLWIVARNEVFIFSGHEKREKKSFFFKRSFKKWPKSLFPSRFFFIVSRYLISPKARSSSQYCFDFSMEQC